MRKSYTVRREQVDKNKIDITGPPLKKREKKLIEKCVKKMVKEYGDVLRKLG